MPDQSSINNDFLGKAAMVIEDRLSDEQFGVSELAAEMGMSRSNLLRVIKRATKKSASQFIRDIRLDHAMQMLKGSDRNVSEVAFGVGFSSTSYFIKCFREKFGYPPGEVSRRVEPEAGAIEGDGKVKPSRLKMTLIISMVIVLLLSFILALPFLIDGQRDIRGKSIAVLPFINDSNDSSNVYIINGLMESILDDLQKIDDLHVVSRTSVERYRGGKKPLSEIAEELGVQYILEGSGQKIADRILLHLQLIDAASDKHLWSKEYTRDVTDVFSLQHDIARDVALSIKVVITPEENERIETTPTSSLEAYDHFLRGLELFYRGDMQSLHDAIELFEMAIGEDPEFANAYANIAISYYKLDNLQKEKKYAEQINTYSDKAMLYDPKLPQSLIAKALFYIYSEEYDLALPYLEKACEYNPNSALALNILSDFYANLKPDTEKYLLYALKSIRLDIASYDSVMASFLYLHVSNAFIQMGFVDEALSYVDKSLAYWPDNLYSAYLKAYVLYARDRDLGRTRQMLLETLAKDTTRLDILQEAGKICFYMREYDQAYVYYHRFEEARKAYGLDIYRLENGKIGYVYNARGKSEEAKRLMEDYKAYAENDHTIYKHLSLAAYYAYMGNTAQAISHLREFSRQDHYYYWIILFMRIDPLFDSIKDEPAFRTIMDEIDNKFWQDHRKVRNMLEEEKVL